MWGDVFRSIFQMGKLRSTVMQGPVKIPSQSGVIRIQTQHWAFTNTLPWCCW